MTKEEKAENYAHNYFDMHDEEFNYKALKRGFLAGWESCERQKALEELTQNNSWIPIEEDLPNNDRSVLIKVRDYRHDIFEVEVGYYDGEWRYLSHNFVNSGHGWVIHSWREIPQ